MNLLYITYKDSTGEILRTGSITAGDFSLQAGSGETVIEGAANDVTQYVVDGVVTDKSANPATIDQTTMSADGEDVTTISNIPNPTKVTLDGVDYDITDGSFGFTVDTAATYVIRLVAFPYLDKEFTVTAT